jgi:hypothetical protein
MATRKSSQVVMSVFGKQMPNLLAVQQILRVQTYHIMMIWKCSHQTIRQVSMFTME